MRAVIYIRFSTPKQERGASRDRQLELCQQFCEQRGWPVDEVIEDLGRSAWTGAHLSAGELGLFANRVRDGGVGAGTVLVVEKLDRLSRQETRTTLRWMEDLCAVGLAIATEDTRLHGGRLEAWGELGEGSTFMVTLPRAPRPAVQGAEAPEPIGRSVLPIPPRYSTADRRYADDLSRPVPQEADADAVGTVADVAATAADAPP